MEKISNYLVVNNKLKKNAFTDPINAFHYHDINKFLEFENGQTRYFEILNNVINDYESKYLSKYFIEYMKNEDRKNYIIIEKKGNEIILKMVNSEITLISVGGYGQIYKISDDVCLKINLENEDRYHEFEIPKHLSQIANETTKELILFPYSILKHCKFNGLVNILQINIFFVYIIYCIKFKIEPTEKELEKKLNNYNIKKEYNILFKTNDMRQLEHAVNLYNFLCVKYLSPEEHINILKYLLRMISIFRDKHGSIKENGFIILMPLLKSNSINLRINKETKKIDNVNGIKSYIVYKYFYRMLFLQMSILILNINDNTTFTHNDFKADNILVDDADPPYELKYKKTVFKFNEHFKFKLADFDFSILDEYTVNSKLTDKEMFKKTNWLTDIHFFIHSLFYFISSDEYKSDKVFFNKLHDYFIKPYCNIDINKLLSGESTIKKKDSKIYCNSGRLVNYESPNISKLYEFITSNLFKEWM